MDHDATIQDVLEAVNAASSATEVRFSELKSDIKTMQSDIKNMQSGMVTMQSDMKTVQSGMATKQDLNKLKLELIDAMDDKNADLKGDLIVLMRKEDNKLAELVTVLKERALIDDNDIRRILGMEPFPKLI